MPPSRSGFRTRKSPAKTAPGADFVAKTGTVTFKAGKTTTKFVTASVLPDTRAEGDETFRVVLSAPTGGYAIGASTATGTIVDDDAAGSGLRVGVGDVTVWEGNGIGVNPAKVSVSLSNPAPATVSVTLTLAQGTATPLTDYKRIAVKTITFLRGQRQKFVSLAAIADTRSEADETIGAVLTNPSPGLGLGRASGTVTIDDDD